MFSNRVSNRVSNKATILLFVSLLTAFNFNNCKCAENKNPVAISNPTSTQTDEKSVVDDVKKVLKQDINRRGWREWTCWSEGVRLWGLWEASEATNDEMFKGIVIKKCTEAHWDCGGHPLEPNDSTVGITYCRIFEKNKDPAIIEKIKYKIDEVIEKTGGRYPHWKFIDYVFMEGPAIYYLYEITNDPKYAKYLTKEWCKTILWLFNDQDKLFYRDKSYINSFSTNGEHTYWGRGNGWAIAGLATVLKDLPPSEERDIMTRTLKELAQKLKSLQQEDGLWRSNLLDPGSIPDPETTTSTLILFGLCKGVNNGVLPKEEFADTITKAFKGISKQIEPSGEIKHCQGVGEKPGESKETKGKEGWGASWNNFGTGCTLLGLVEYKKYLENNREQVVH